MAHTEFILRPRFARTGVVGHDNWGLAETALTGFCFRWLGTKLGGAFVWLCRLKSLLSIFLLALLPFPAAGADLCQDLVKDIRSRPNIMSGNESAATGIRQAPAFLIEISRYDSKADEEIFSVPSAKTYAIVFSGGAWRCRGINFYHTGKTKLELPLPPVPNDRDLLEGNACEGSPQTYEFAFGTIHRRPAFLFSQADLVDFNESIWIAGLRGSTWDKGCRVDAKFEPILPPPHAFVSTESGLDGPEWTKLAADIAQTHGAVLENPNFHFGAAVPEASKALADKLLAAIKTDWLMGLPLFGNSDQDAANFSMNGNGGMSFHTVMLNGHPYTLEIGHRSGFRDSASREMGMILFDWKDGKAVPVASAFIDVKRGPLKSLTIH